MPPQLIKPKSKIVSIAVSHLTPIPLDIPPEWWEKAIGYQGSERYWACYFDKRTLYYDDGSTWHRAVKEPFIMWHDTPGMKKIMNCTGIKQGYTYFLLDRIKRVSWHGDRPIVMAVLLSQSPPWGGYRTGSPGWKEIKDEITAKMLNWWLSAGYVVKVVCK